MTRRNPPQVIDRSDAQWHLDRKVPIALMMSILVQTAVIVWWGATTDARLNTLEQRADLAAPQADRLTRVEVKVDNMVAGIAEIKSILRKDNTPQRNR